MQLIINFFKGLFNESGKVSSKRVVGFCSFIQMCQMVIGQQYFHRPMDMTAFGIFFSLTCYCFTLNTVLQGQALGAKKDVASDMVNSTQDNETAKDVLQSDKPNT